MKLIVGLGNPGKEYNNTRHNIGFMYLDYLYGNSFVMNKKFNAMEYDTNINGERVIFIKPLSYMNLSGEVVKNYVNFYKIDVNSMLVIQDDLDMDLGKIKLMYNHGDGGHNGIKNIILNLGSREFLRLKIGISNSGSMDTKDYVLSKFSKNDLDVINDIFKGLSNFVFDYMSMNKDLLMGKYNRKNQEG